MKYTELLKAAGADAIAPAPYRKDISYPSPKFRELSGSYSTGDYLNKTKVKDSDGTFYETTGPDGRVWHAYMRHPRKDASGKILSPGNFGLDVSTGPMTREQAEMLAARFEPLYRDLGVTRSQFVDEALSHNAMYEEQVNPKGWMHRPLTNLANWFGRRFKNEKDPAAIADMRGREGIGDWVQGLGHWLIGNAPDFGEVVKNFAQPHGIMYNTDTKYPR